MISQELIDYVTQHRGAGHSDEAIREQLLAAGHSYAVCTEVLQAAPVAQTTPENQTTQTDQTAQTTTENLIPYQPPQSSSKFSLTNVIILLVIVVGIVIVGAYFLIQPSINSGRDRAANSNIKINLSTARAEGEIYYNRNKNSYANVCDSDSVSTYGFASLKEAADEANRDGVVVCNDSQAAWAMSAQLVDNPDTHYCVDNTGFSETINAPLTTKQVSCTGEEVGAGEGGEQTPAGNLAEYINNNKPKPKTEYLFLDNAFVDSDNTVIIDYRFPEDTLDGVALVSTLEERRVWSSFTNSFSQDITNWLCPAVIGLDAHEVSVNGAFYDKNEDLVGTSEAIAPGDCDTDTTKSDVTSPTPKTNKTQSTNRRNTTSDRAVFATAETADPKTRERAVPPASSNAERDRAAPTRRSEVSFSAEDLVEFYSSISTFPEVIDEYVVMDGVSAGPNNTFNFEFRFTQDTIDGDEDFLVSDLKNELLWSIFAQGAAEGGAAEFCEVAVLLNAHNVYVNTVFYDKNRDLIGTAEMIAPGDCR